MPDPEQKSLPTDTVVKSDGINCLSENWYLQPLSYNALQACRKHARAFGVVPLYNHQRAAWHMTAMTARSLLLMFTATHENLQGQHMQQYTKQVPPDLPDEGALAHRPQCNPLG